MKKLILLSLFASSFLFAADKTAYATQDVDIYLDANSKKSIGKIELSTPLKLISQDDKFDKVQITGWSSEGFENVLFKDIGQRIIYLRADESIRKNAKIIKTKTDDYDSTWNKVSYKVWIKKGNLADNIDEALKKGKEIYTNRCGACHASHDTKHYTANQWPNIIKSMEDRAGLNKSEKQSVIKYVQNNSK